MPAVKRARQELDEDERQMLKRNELEDQAERKKKAKQKPQD